MGPVDVGVPQHHPEQDEGAEQPGQVDQNLEAGRGRGVPGQPTGRPARHQHQTHDRPGQLGGQGRAAARLIHEAGVAGEGVVAPRVEPEGGHHQPQEPEDQRDGRHVGVAAALVLEPPPQAGPDGEQDGGGQPPPDAVGHGRAEGLADHAPGRVEQRAAVGAGQGRRLAQHRAQGDEAARGHRPHGQAGHGHAPQPGPQAQRQPGQGHDDAHRHPDPGVLLLGVGLGEQQAQVDPHRVPVALLAEGEVQQPPQPGQGQDGEHQRQRRVERGGEQVLAQPLPHRQARLVRRARVGRRGEAEPLGVVALDPEVGGLAHLGHLSAPPVPIAASSLHQPHTGSPRQRSRQPRTRSPRHRSTSLRRTLNQLTTAEMVSEQAR